MIELCMTPIVPRELPRSRNGTFNEDSPETNTAESGLRIPGDGEMCLLASFVKGQAILVVYAQASQA